MRIIDIVKHSIHTIIQNYRVWLFQHFSYLLISILFLLQHVSVVHSVLKHRDTSLTKIMNFDYNTIIDLLNNHMPIYGNLLYSLGFVFILYSLFKLYYYSGNVMLNENKTTIAEFLNNCNRGFSRQLIITLVSLISISIISVLLYLSMPLFCGHLAIGNIDSDLDIRNGMLRLLPIAIFLFFAISSWISILRIITVSNSNAMSIFQKSIKLIQTYFKNITIWLFIVFSIWVLIFLVRWKGYFDISYKSPCIAIIIGQLVFFIKTGIHILRIIGLKKIVTNDNPSME